MYTKIQMPLEYQVNPGYIATCLLSKQGRSNPLKRGVMPLGGWSFVIQLFTEFEKVPQASKSLKGELRNYSPQS